MTNAQKQLQALVHEGVVLEGRYRIGRRIGAGAYNMIFTAIDEVTSEKVAIKAIAPDVAQINQTALARFERELKVIRTLVHGNIIALYDWGHTPEGLLFMVLEYINGNTLDAVVRDAPLSPSNALDVLLQLASALETAHMAGVIHRDLKPSNVMLSQTRNRGYRAKIVDFGLAKVLAPLDDESLVDLTHEGMAVGTPRYIAPEQARGLHIGPPADLYALGLLFYEMLTGHRAVNASTVEDAVLAHVSPDPLILQDRHLISPPIQPLLDRLLAKDVRSRFQTATEVIDFIRTLPQAEELLLPPPTSRSSAAKMSSSSTFEFDHDDVLATFEFGDSRRSSTSSEYAKSSKEQSRRPLFHRKKEDLELDYDRYRAFAHKSHDPIARRRQFSLDRWLRLPKQGSEWFEAFLSLSLCILSFLIVTAQASSLEYLPRLGLGLLAPCLALALATYKHSPIWQESLGRYAWSFCLVALIGAHLLGPARIATELSRSPTWFLLPLEGLPGIHFLAMIVQQIATLWANLLHLLMELLGVQT